MHLHRRHRYTTPFLSTVFDSSLGYPGEGPSPVRITSTNLNGMSSKRKLRETCSSARRLGVSVLLIQHTNIYKDSTKWGEYEAVAHSAGFKLIYPLLPHRGRRANHSY